VAFKQDAQPTPETPVHYDSTAAAVRALLADADPRVIAFGEFHPCTDPPAYKTAKAYFAEEVLPVLKEEGITDLIVEQILNDPKIIEELDAFYNDKTLAIGPLTTPTLWHTFGYYVHKEDLINLLNKARDLGIRLIPGGMTHEEADKTIHRTDYQYRTDLRLLAWNYTEIAVKAAIDQLLEGEGRFAIYGGSKHHNYVSSRIGEREGGTNYGEYLAGRLNDDYMEIELFPVDGLRTQNPNNLDFLGMSNWQELAPSNGVNRIDQGLSHILMVAPSN
jgi:hypothetical protein